MVDAKIKEKSADIHSHPTFRALLVLFAILDLVLLGIRLWPWQNILSLPEGGATAIDPAATLVAYIGLAFLIARVQEPAAKRFLFSSAILGVLGGLLLAGYVLVSGHAGAGDVAPNQYMQIGLLVATAIVWGFAGMRAARAQESIGFSVICSVWSAFVSCTMAFAAVMGQVYVVAVPAESSDPWKQYEGLAVGSAAMQSLIQSLNTATGFLLIGPLVAIVAGAVFATLGQPRKS